MKSLNKNWQFNLLGIYNFNSYGSFHNLIQFIKNNHHKIEGDIVEAGVFRGNSLLSIALFLKKLGSSKKSLDLIHFQVSRPFITKEIISKNSKIYLMKTLLIKNTLMLSNSIKVSLKIFITKILMEIHKIYLHPVNLKRQA